MFPSRINPINLSEANINTEDNNDHPELENLVQDEIEPNLGDTDPPIENLTESASNPIPTGNGNCFFHAFPKIT